MSHGMVKPHKWTPPQLRLMMRYYREWGPDKMAQHLGLERQKVINKASKMGLRTAGKVMQELPEHTGGPRPYRAEWKPLVQQEGLPRRPGADDSKKIPSL